MTETLSSERVSLVSGAAYMITYALIATMLLPINTPSDPPRPQAQVVEAGLEEANCREKALILQQRSDPDQVSYVCLIDMVGE
jgi:hypothetical protein